MSELKTLSTLQAGEGTFAYYDITAVEGAEKLPYALKVLLENALRNAADEAAAQQLAQRIVEAGLGRHGGGRGGVFPGPRAVPGTSPACRCSWTSP